MTQAGILAVPGKMGQFSGDFFFGLVAIVLIDILLAGDNAVVIAMAVKSLPPAQRRRGVLIGAGGAVVLRIVLTFFAARILELSFVKLAGGLLILWIAVKLLIEKPGEEEDLHPASGLAHAIRMVLVADVTMSLDNILAVAASSKGNLILLVIGLALSISFVVFASGILSRIMDRFPAVIWIGGAILGRVAGEMLITDPWIDHLINPSDYLRVGVQLLCSAGVVAAGWLINKRNKLRSPRIL